MYYRKNSIDKKCCILLHLPARPPPYEDPTPLQVVRAQTQGGRNYATDVIQTQSNAPSEEESIDINDIQDFMCPNIFACLCCCWPIGLIGIVFSMLCRSAKSEGNREQAKCFSVTAGVLCALSIIGAVITIIVIVSIQ